MNTEDGKTKPASQAGKQPRKAYGPPRLRSLGHVNVVTLTPPTDLGGRKKPTG